MRHRRLMLINIDGNPKITTLGLKKCLSMLLEEEHSRPTLDKLHLSTESLLNDENKKIIEKINSIRITRNVPPLCVDYGMSRHVEDKLTYPEKKKLDWIENNKELADKEKQKFIATRYNSRSAH